MLEAINAVRIPHTSPSTHGIDLQEYTDSRGVFQGVMTQYPGNDKEVADMFRSAIRNAPPGGARVINLMERGDLKAAGFGTQSYVDALPEGKPTRVGDLEMIKTTKKSGEPIGRNLKGETIRHDVCSVKVRDTKDPSGTWHDVRYDAVDHWTDTKAMPLRSFDNLCSALHDPKRDGNFGMVHCAGGIGRTGTYALRDMARRHIERENAAGRHVEFKEILSDIRQWTLEMRDLRGPGFMPDSMQLDMVMHSVHGLCARQRV